MVKLNSAIKRLGYLPSLNENTRQYNLRIYKFCNQNENIACVLQSLLTVALSCY